MLRRTSTGEVRVFTTVKSNDLINGSLMTNPNDDEETPEELLFDIQ